MAPSSHSSSSHSSSSHSSSSHSSSHSSSSHSSSSSGWSSSSSSWSSSSSYSKSKLAVDSFFRGKTSQFVADGKYAGTIIVRPRTNQPSGWTKTSEHHYCAKHNYVYFSEGWIDSKTGKHYDKGYYDENGTYYDDIIFKRNGKYENVLCECPFCKSSFKIDWTEDGQLPNCKNCGAVMEIKSSLDEYTQDPNYSNFNIKKISLKERFLNDYKRILPGIMSIILWMSFVGAIYIYGSHDAQKRRNNNTYSNNYTQQTQNYAYQDYKNNLSNVDIFGTTLYLKQTENNTYIISNEDTSNYDKKLIWDKESQSYYDAETDCYIWYNTDVSPYLWQYWYEGVSSDFGDYGWMEWEKPDNWYIEESNGNWIELPESYNTENMWHIEKPNAFNYDDVPVTSQP